MSHAAFDAMPAATSAQPEPSLAKASPAAWFAFFTLCAVTLLRWVDQVVLVVGTEPMKKSLFLSDLQVGMIHGFGLSLAASVGAIPLAWLADRYDRRKVLAGAVFAWSLATAYRAYVTSFGEVMASTVGMAVADAALIPIAYAMLPLLFRGRQLATVNLVYYSMSCLGYSVAMMLTGAVFKFLDTHQAALPAILSGMEAWRSSSLIVGALGPIFCIMVLNISSVAGQRARALSTKSTGGTESSTFGVTDYLKLHWRAILGIYGSAAFGGISMAPLMSFLAPALSRRFGLDAGEVGAMVGTVFLASTIAGLAISGLLQRVLAKSSSDLVALKTAPFLTLVAGAGLASIPFFGVPQSIYVCMGVVLAALVAFNAGMPLIYQKMAPASVRARITAIPMAVSLVLVAGAPVLVGYLSGTMHSENGLLLASAYVGVPAAVLSALLLWWGRSHALKAVQFSENADRAAGL